MMSPARAATLRCDLSDASVANEGGVSAVAKVDAATCPHTDCMMVRMFC